MIIVTTVYSFDSEVMARIFSDIETASEFIKRDYFNERKLTETENDYEEILEDGCYCEEHCAKLTYYDSWGDVNYMEWNIATIDDLRGIKIEERFPNLKPI